jgi:hypothetical protein
MTNAIHRTPVPGDRAGQDAAQRARELHARRQLHPRRGARAARLLRLRGLQFRRHRQQRRRRAADGRVDRRRRGAVRPVGRGHPPLRRLHRQPPALAERTGETLGLHYAMRWPRQELESRRGRCARRRCTTCWPRAAPSSAARTAGSAPTTSAPPAPRPRRTRPGHARLAAWMRPSSAPRARRWRCTTRPPSASCCCRAATRWRCCSACAPTRSTCPGRMVYTAMLNARGGFESDLTVMRQAPTASCSSPARRSRARRRLDRRHIGPDAAVVLTDVSALTSVLSVMGPRRASCWRASARTTCRRPA